MISKRCATDAMQMVLQYRSGEEITKGARVLFHGKPAEVGFVVSGTQDPEMRWHVQEFGGVMILDPLASGRTFISSDQIQEYEDLEFLSRATD